MTTQFHSSPPYFLSLLALSPPFFEYPALFPPHILHLALRVMFSLDIFFNNSTIFVCHYLVILFLFCLWGRVWGWDRLWWGSVWFPSEPSLNHPPLTLTLLHMFSSYLLLFRCYKRDTRSQYINRKLILLKKWGTFAIRIFIFKRIIKPNNKDSYKYS